MSGELLIPNENLLLPSAKRQLAWQAQQKSVLSGKPPVTTTQDTTVYYWYLAASQVTTLANTAPSDTQGFNRIRDPVGAEAIVNVLDGRTKVHEKHFKDNNGKYRGIVKLFLLYENSLGADDEATWPVATGWLVAPDIVVTAGHCAFDWSHGLGRLTKVKAYIGYKGHADLSGTEAQWGTAVATTVPWCSGIGNEPSDISIIKLSSPFNIATSNLFRWTQTPVSQDGADLGVVGYPADIMENGERGARMYEMFTSTTYNLANSEQHMLQYKIDTYGGNSGSPVFNSKDSLTAIGVHVLGGYSYNSASVFDGRYGNRFYALQLTASRLTDLDHNLKGASQPDKNSRSWLWQITQRTTEADADLATKLLSKSLVEAQKVVATIPDHLLYAIPSDLSFGPDAGPEISILAATAIATAGRLAADSRGGAHAESLATTRPYGGIINRAVLAEAALQYYSGVLSLNVSDKEKVEEFMAPVVAGLAPFVLKIAPRLLKGVVEPSFRLLLSRIAGKTTPDSVRREKAVTEAEFDTGFGRQLQGKEKEFFDELMRLAQADESNAESFCSTLITVGDFIGSAFKKAGPFLADVAKIGLPLLLGTEAETATPKTNLDPLAHRAIVAEACLQSLVQLRTELNLKDKFFKDILGKVRDLGPKLINVAPYAVRFVGPIVGDILREIDEKKKAAEKKQEFLDFTWN
ncbi:ATP synthase F1 [Xylaria telfairii]|nr:ATP synthase F1 [Xylaria telfairii]